MPMSVDIRYPASPDIVRCQCRFGGTNPGEPCHEYSNTDPSAQVHLVSFLMSAQNTPLPAEKTRPSRKGAESASTPNISQAAAKTRR
jgi:hypothetical protein